jgi:hypothetical protein
MAVEPTRVWATVVFSDLDGIPLDPDPPAFETAAYLLEQIIPDDVALCLFWQDASRAGVYPTEAARS